MSDPDEHWRKVERNFRIMIVLLAVVLALRIAILVIEWQ